MTTKKIEGKRVHEVIETPKFEVKATKLLEAVKTLNTLDKVAKTQKTAIDGFCNDLVREFSGFTEKTYTTKMRAMFDKSNLYYKTKNGVVRSDALKMTQTAQTVVSTTKRYILAGQEVTAKTSYSEIKEYFRKLLPQLSENRKLLNKEIALMSDSKVTHMIALLRQSEKTEKVNGIIEAETVKAKKLKAKKPLIQKSKGRMAKAS